MRKTIPFLLVAIAAAIVSILILKSLNFPLDVENKRQQSQETPALLRSELREAWEVSHKFTLEIVNQMPDEYFGFRYTPESMSFAEQWRHCCIYTCGQLANRFELSDNPYEDKANRPPIDMDKESVIAELNKMYTYVNGLITELPEEKLYHHIDFAEKSIPGWRLFYAMENHIIHHRGACIVYLRLKGITPKGYYGW